MQPRHKLDIAVADLLSVFAPVFDAPQTLSAEAAMRFGGERPAVVGFSARTLFDAALTALEIPAGSGAIMSAVNIETMFTIAESHELKVTGLDLAMGTLLPSPQALEAALRATAARLVVIAQLYGAVSPLNEFADVCRRHGAMLIEDASQAFSGDFHKGDPDADISLFSFGPIKRATALGGAVAAMRSREHAAAMEAILARWPVKPERWLRMRALKIAGLKAISPPLIYGLLLRLIALLRKDADALIGRAARGFGPGDILTQIRFQPPRSLLRLLARRLGQRHDVRQRGELPGDFGKSVVVPGMRAQKHAHWLMPVLCNDPAEFVARARRQGVDATRGATSLRAFGDPRETPAAHDLIRRVVYWPLC
ncbi:MAG: DegT/DnrJ/EryC1/StrS family aminotransferase [Chthoniobacteraceae bacterium]